MLNAMMRAALPAVMIAVTVFGLRAFAANSTGTVFSDFRAFYCAASVAANGEDPYLQGPLYHCERQAAPPLLWRARENVANPAPLPPYALALVIPLAKLPFGAVCWVWAAIVVASYAVTVITLRRLTALAWPALCCAILPASVMSLSLGQIAPVAIALMCLSALLLHVERPALAGAAAALALVEPHLALPSCVALFLIVKRARTGLLSAGCVFLALSFSMGAHRTFEYLTSVLPAHAASDVADVGQFSGTMIAHLLGAGDSLALTLGTLSYLAMASAGILAAAALAKKEQRTFYAALIPMAFSVMAGSYIHWNQVVAAVPAALALAAKASRISPFLGAALIMLPIPWLYVTAWGFLIPASAMLAGALSWYFGGRRVAPAAACAAAVLFVLWFANHSLTGAAQPAPFHAAVLPNDFADASWGSYVRARIAISRGPFLWAHFPTWIALLCFAGAALHACAQKTAPALRASMVRP
jgi:hypothetical protein